MKNRFIATDGSKAIDLLNSNDPTVWQFFTGAPQSSRTALYAYVAAVYRAFNLKANTVGNMPFILYKGKEEFDTSANWENKVGFMPNPSELFRLDTLSYIDTNTVYNLRTQDILGYKTKGLYFAVPTTFKPITNGQTGALEYIEREVGTSIERYKPEDKRLIRMWRLDHTTEILPSENTEAKAIQNSAEQVLYTDSWIKHYYKRGGIKPTLVAMKGLAFKEKVEDEEKSWTAWLRGLGRYFGNIARVYNAEALDVKAFGDGVAELRNNEVYKQALSNIAMGHGMPLSLLLANSANYATAKEEKATWFENDIIPFSNWLAYEYNKQVFEPIGLRLEFKPETLDPQQEDETARAQAFSTYMDALTKCPSYEIFLGMAETLGLELTDSLKQAAEKYYGDKEKREQEMQDTMGRAGYVVGSDNKPIPVQVQKEGEPKKEKWTPTLDELEELRIWREVALRRHKKGDSLVFEYQPHRGGLPEAVTTDIQSRLAEAREWTPDTIKTVFEIAQTVSEPERKAESEIQALAAAMNRYADALFTKPVPVST